LPRTEVIYFREKDGSTPIVDWFDDLPAGAVFKCLARLARLEELGHELRRPEADYLEDGIYELRAKHLGVNYRILYFFHGRAVAWIAWLLEAAGKGPRARDEHRSHAEGCVRRKPSSPHVQTGELAMARKHRFESKALQFTYDRYVGEDARHQAAFDEALAGAAVARQLYELRTKAGLTQTRLAQMVGTSTSAISRLEDADYDGHSLSVLRRIASALNRRVEVTFVPLRTRAPLSRGAKRTNSRASASSRVRKKRALD
jgi:transcriptional regulator with XRE-family HTH domain